MRHFHNRFRDLERTSYWSWLSIPRDWAGHRDAFYLRDLARFIYGCETREPL